MTSEKGHGRRLTSAFQAKKHVARECFEENGQTGECFRKQPAYYLSIAARASCAAPMSGAISLSTTETGILVNRPSKRHLSLKFLKKVPSFILSIILMPMPPAT